MEKVLTKFHFHSISAWKFYQNSDSNSSRKLFRYSLLQLPLLLVLFIVNRKGSKNKDDLKPIENLNTNS